ncbi:MAG TPA: hypothetical protein VGI78_02655 [Acetobacteraceae bacterium]|jgi:hypothetical protein
MAVLKGALVSFTATGGLGLPPLPNIIVFQINPETITHAWTEAASPPPPQPKPNEPPIHVSALAVTGNPGENFSFTLMLDSDEQISDVATDPIGAGLAAVSGVYTRLAALELLQFPSSPPSGGLVGQVSAAASAAASGTSAGDSQSQAVPASQVPVVLFVWGPLRIVPVRVTALSVTEKLFDELLNPTHAEAQITLSVLTPDDLADVAEPMRTLAMTAYEYTLGLRQAQAIANLAESAAGVVGMLATAL